MRELARNTSKLVGDVHETGVPVVITRNGRPIAAIYPVDEAALEDFVLANAPAYVAAMREADDDLRLGLTRSLAEVLPEIEAG